MRPCKTSLWRLVLGLIYFDSIWERKELELIREKQSVFPPSLCKSWRLFFSKLVPSIWLAMKDWRSENYFSFWVSSLQSTSSIKKKLPEFRSLRYSLLVFNAKFTGALKTFQRSPHWGFTSVSSVLQIILQILVVHSPDLHKWILNRNMNINTQNCISPNQHTPA